MTDQRCIGAKNGLLVYASENLIAQYGEKQVRRNLGLIKEFPVKVDLSGHAVMVEAESQEDAIEIFIKSKAANEQITL